MNGAPGEMGLRPVLGGFLAALVTPYGAHCVRPNRRSRFVARRIELPTISIDGRSPAVKIASRSTGFEASHSNFDFVISFKYLQVDAVP